MKAIQIMMDEDLLKEIDSDQEVRDGGRSAFFRRAASLYLQKRRKASILSEYQAAYRVDRNPDQDLDGWEEEGTWPKNKSRRRMDVRITKGSSSDQ